MTAAAARPDLRFRYWGIVLLLFLAGAINYVDRQTLSILKPMVKSALSTDDAGYALLVNVFTFCYAGAYIVTGWVVDKLGAHKGLILFITVWSLATLGCGFANTFLGFAVCRAILGLAEPGNQPVSMRALTLWAPERRRAFVMSLVGAGGTVGSIVAAPLIAWLASTHGWHAAFVVPGVIGLALGLLWWFVYRHPPTQEGSATETKKTETLPALPWKRLWFQRSLWGIVLARFVSDPVWYFCLFWMPGYFQEQRGLSLEEAGRVGWIPFFAASLCAIAIAAWSDRLGKRLGDPLRARKRVLLFLALFGPITALVPHLPGLGLTVAALCVVAIVCLSTLTILGPVVADAFPAGNVASVWSIAGAFGAFGAIIFNHQIGHLTAQVGTGTLFFVLGTLHLIACAILLALVRKVNLAAEA